ncbi:MAG: ABC transporter substrate-binding protein [Deltaproteobacteria bacterium]|nr:ABC transporter substrate-binding protein [Deltaproteobacteria bacterium]
MKRYHRIRFAAFLFGILNSLPSLSVLAAAAPTKIAVGYATISSASTTLWVAQDEKFFTKYGIDADLVFMPGAPTLIAAINSGALAIGYTGGTAILGAVAGGTDLKIIAASQGRVLHDLVVRHDIKKAEDLRGKRVGVTSIGGSGWMAAMLAFEQLGINPDKDKLIVSAFGDMRIIAKAFEAGNLDGALVTGNLISQFKRAGYNVLSELEKVQMLGSAVVVKQSMMTTQTELLRNVIRALTEAHAFVLSPSKHGAVLRVISKRLNITDPTAAEDGLQDLLKRIDKKLFPSLDGLRNIQRLLQTRNSKIGQIKLQEVIDDSLVRELEKSGFNDRVLGDYGVK